jgi:uncharacterized 2Fe-2S/4Fe-4S cluster protein (DUF4445 family)
MPLITFKPSDTTIDVPSGTDLLQAARQAGVDIDAPCGGKGTCGKCLVKVVSGNLGTGGRGMFDKDDQPGIVQACTTVVGDGPVVIDVPNGVGYEGGKFAEDVGTHDASSALTPDPATLRIAVTISEAGSDAVEPDVERLTKSLLPHIGTKSLVVPLNVLQLLPETLRVESGQITVTVENPIPFPSSKSNRERGHRDISALPWMWAPPPWQCNWYNLPTPRYWEP